VTEQEDGGPFVGRAGLELVYEQLRSLHLGHANIVDTAPVLRSVALERRSDIVSKPSNTCGRMEEGTCRRPT
jgi:hypothetical protein